MTQELGATSGLFPSDELTRRFLRAQGREQDWTPLAPDPGATYDEELTIDLDALEPLIAKPHSPDNGDGHFLLACLQASSAIN